MKVSLSLLRTLPRNGIRDGQVENLNEEPPRTLFFTGKPKHTRVQSPKVQPTATDVTYPRRPFWRHSYQPSPSPAHTTPRASCDSSKGVYSPTRAPLGGNRETSLFFHPVCVPEVIGFRHYPAPVTHWQIDRSDPAVHPRQSQRERWYLQGVHKIREGREVGLPASHPGLPYRSLNRARGASE